MNAKKIEQAYGIAKDRYAALGVDTDKALRRLAGVAVSLHCWQGDDVGGFERDETALSGGIMATGNYPGKARTPDELRADLDEALSLIPGRHRLNLHAIYGEFGGKRVDRNEIEPKHYQGWIDWAKHRGLGMDFNPSCFSHPKAADGFTLSHANAGIRQFWIEHCAAARKVGAAMGKALGSPCVNNVWIPDGYKDVPADRLAPRQRLAAALDEVFAKKYSTQHLIDAVECKLFGIGSESYVVGSHEFYMGYAVKHNLALCLDAGHFHPTEVISDKISSALMFVDQLLLHVSRGVRWDSDHVVTYTEELQAIAQEIVRHGYLGRVHIGLDFFDASINRIAAWVIGSRNMLKALCAALLEPTAKLCAAEKAGDHTTRLAMLEELKLMPVSAVWDYYCLSRGVPVGLAWLDEVKRYERDVLALRK